MIVNIINTVIYLITLFIFAEVVLSDTIINFKKIYVLIPIFVLCIFLNASNFSPLITLFYLLFSVISITVLYSISPIKSLMILFLFFINVAVIDFILSTLLFIGSLYKTIKVNYSFYINVFIFTCSLLPLLSFKMRNFYKTFISKSSKLNKRQIICVLVLIISTIVLSIALSKGRNFEDLLIFFILFFSFLILSIILMKQYNEKNLIINKYNELDNYVNTFEDKMNKQRLNIHEYKNQLSIIKGFRNKREANSYIDKILFESVASLENDLCLLRKIDYLPLRSLIQYKKIIAKNKNVRFMVDTNKNIKFSLDSKKEKHLMSFLGVFIDNAIEAAEECSNGYVLIEFYSQNNNNVIVITNSIKNLISLNKIEDNGYSTKGKNRGIGLYLVKNINKHNKYFDIKTEIKNDLFIKKIIIKDCNEVLS